MKLKGLGAMLVMQARWRFDRRWRESTRSRVLRERKAAEAAGKPFKMTALRRFVLDRPAPKKTGYLDRTYSL